MLLLFTGNAGGYAGVVNNNIIVYTGGASQWQTPEIDADENAIFKLESNGFTKISSTDAKNMGEADTLSEFISYGLENYSTDKYGLILWNHGARTGIRIWCR